MGPRDPLFGLTKEMHQRLREAGVEFDDWHFVPPTPKEKEIDAMRIKDLVTGDVRTTTAASAAKAGLPYAAWVAPALSEPVVPAILPTDAAARKGIPVTTGVLDYFPAAIAAVAEVSRVGNEQHNPGEPLHWVRGKSTDQADTIARHLLERGTLDSDGLRHSAKLAWRALAMLQLELEAEGAPKARGAV